MSRTRDDLCPAGDPIPMGPCQKCGATEDDDCKLADEMSPREVRENVAAYLAGREIPN